MNKKLVVLFCAICCSATAMASEPAATIGSITSHGGVVMQGSSTVLIEGKAAAHQGNFASCPVLMPIPHIGGTIATGSTTVLINGFLAARKGDVIAEPTGTGQSILLGAPTVLIGN